MAERPCAILKFLSIVEGNWRNAVFIDACAPSVCKAGTPCGGHLFTTDGDGEPILIPAKLFCTLTGELIDPAFAQARELHRRQTGCAVRGSWLLPSRRCPAWSGAAAPPDNFLSGDDIP